MLFLILGNDGDLKKAIADAVTPLFAELKEHITMSDQETADALAAQVDANTAALVEKLTKAKGEIVAEIAKLSVEHPGVDFSALEAAVANSLAASGAVAQELDDIVPDPVVEEPVAPAE